MELWGARAAVVLAFAVAAMILTVVAGFAVSIWMDVSRRWRER